MKIFCVFFNVQIKLPCAALSLYCWFCKSSRLSSGLHAVKTLLVITRSELASLTHTLLGGALILQMLNCNWKWSLIPTAHALAHILVGHLTQPAKKLVTRPAGLLERTPGKRCLVQNRLLLRNTDGQCWIPMSSPSGRHWWVPVLISALSHTLLKRLV